MESNKTAAQLAAENLALKQQNDLLARNIGAQKARCSELAKAATAGTKDNTVTKLGTTEKARATLALKQNAEAVKSAVVEQVLADQKRTAAYMSLKSETGKMLYETEFGKYAGESEPDKDRLIEGATRLDKRQEQMKMSDYIASLKTAETAKAEKDQKMAALDQALRDGRLDQGTYDKERRNLGFRKDGDFMLDLNDKLVESARTSAGKIQDVLGTKMYDFVAEKFDKMGLSFLNNVAKMVTSAASAKLMETLFGSNFMKNENGGGLGGWISTAGNFISDLFGGGGAAAQGAISVGSSFVSGGTALSSFSSLFPSAKGNAFTNGMVSSPVAFPMGVMGEAGPEAIMPLHRGADGSLGIRAAFPNVAGDTGQMGGGVAVNVYVQDGNVNSETESGEGGWKQFGQQIGEYVNQLVDRRMTQSYRQGGLAWQASNNRLAGA